MRIANTAAAIAAILPLALAQTSTDCDPTKKTCPDDTGLPASTYSADFTTGSSSNASWSAAAGTNIEYGSDGAVFTIASEGQAPTIQTDFYIFFGHIDVIAKAASGTGIVSSIVLLGDDLDEIDWEFVGGTPNKVQSNYYGKGNTTTYDRVVYHDVADTQDTWHTYSIDWTAERIEYIIDGTTVRTLEYADAVGGQNFPQTPMRLKLGNWAGGSSSSEGTVEWAGGPTDYSQAPFNMYVKSVSVQNYNPACSYGFTDLTGSWESIDVIKTGDSCSASDSSTSASSSGSATSSKSSSATVSPTGSGESTSVESTATSAPTSSQAVQPIANTKLPPATTITGSAYSTNTASVSAVNSPVAASTGVVFQPTIGVNGTFSGSGSNPTSSVEPSTGAASPLRVMALGSLLSLAAAMLLL